MLLASPPCRQVCDDLALQCASDPIVWSVLPPSITNCNSIDSNTNSPSYPVSSAYLSLGNSNFSVPCSSATLNISRPFQGLHKGRCDSFVTPTLYSQCSQVVSWNRVFVPEGVTQAQLDYQALNSTFHLLYRQVDERCSAAALEFICAGIFLGCETVMLDSLQIERTALDPTSCKQYQLISSVAVCS